MKNLKKLIAVVLTLAMIIGTMTTVSFAYSDVDASNNNYEAITVLTGLGAVKGDDEGNFNADANVKRSEVATMLCRVLGQESAALSATGYTRFDDVSTDHWAVGYINWAADNNIVNGVGDGNFNPDADVKYQEVVKMIVSALGYGPYAAKKGGYPTGYLVIAGSNTVGITSGVSVSGETAATRGTVAQLLFNSFDVPLVDTSTISLNGDDEYAIYKGDSNYERRTLLTYYSNVAKVYAKVTANNVTAINSSSATEYDKDKGILVRLEADTNVNKNGLLASGFVIDSSKDNYYEYFNGDFDIGEKPEAYAGSTTIADCLGKNVIAYIGYDEDDDMVVLAYTENNKKMDSLVITKDIVTANADGVNAPAFEYWKDKDNDNSVTDDTEIAANAAVIVNGKYVGKLTQTAGQNAFNAIVSDMNNNELSKVELTGVKNAAYDTIYLTNYKYGVVDKVDTDNKTIDFKDGSNVWGNAVKSQLDLSDDNTGDDFVLNISLNGEKIGLADLQENDVLNMIFEDNDSDVDDDTKFLTIDVTRNAVEGKVTSKSSDSSEATISGTTYDLLSGLGVNVSDEGTYFLTNTGKIVAYQATSSKSDNYVFLKGIDISTSYGSTTYTLQVFTKEGKTVEYKVASSLKVKDYNAANASAVTYKKDDSYAKGTQSVFGTAASAYIQYTQNTAGDYFLAGTDVEDRIVTISVNSSDEISEICLAKSSNTADSDSLVYKTVTAAAYKQAKNTIGKYNIGDSILFYAPKVTPYVATKDAFDLDNIAIKNFSAMEDDETFTTSLYLYDFDSDKNFKLAVATEDKFGTNGALAVIKKISTGTNFEGESADIIEYVMSGETYTTALSDASVSGLAKGDIIQISLDGNSEIDNITLIYDYSTVGTDYKTGNLTVPANTTSNKTKYYFGIVYDASSNGITLTNDIKASCTSTSSYAGEKDLSIDATDTSTFAIIDANALDIKGSSSFVDIYSAASSLKECYEYDEAGKTAAAYAPLYGKKARYLAVVKEYDGDVTDVVEIKLPESTGSDLGFPATLIANFQLAAEKVVEIEAPAVEAPAATEAPVVEAPATEAPATEAPIEAPIEVDLSL